MRIALLFAASFSATFGVAWMAHNAQAPKPPGGGRGEVYGAPEIVVETPDFGAGCDVTAPEGFNEAVQAASQEFLIDPWILAVTAYRESDCRPGVTGGSGEIGMTQIHPRWWTESLQEAGIIEEVSDLYVMETNLRASAWIMARLQRHGEQEMFRRYNGTGPAAEKYAREQVRALNEMRGDS